MHHLASLPKTSQVINRSEKTAFGPVHLLLMTPNGLAVVTGSKDGTARIWDLGMGKMVGLVLDCVCVPLGHVSYSNVIQPAESDEYLGVSKV